MEKALFKRGFIGGLIFLILVAALAYGFYNYTHYGDPFATSDPTNEDGSSTSDFSYNVQPEIFSLDPSSAEIGDLITISGTGFVPTDNTVTFGSYTLGIFASADGKTVNIKVPTSLNDCQSSFCNNFVYNLEPGQFPISVKNKNGTSNVVNLQIGGGGSDSNAVKTYP